jgi:hypothetical protein
MGAADGGRRGALARLADLRPGDLVTLGRAFWAMWTARALIAGMGFPRAARALRLEQGGDPVRAQRDPALPARTRRAVRVTLALLGKEPLGVTCLPRSIAVERVLRKRGTRAEIVLGAVHDAAFSAHAWVEVDGTPIGWGELGALKYARLARFEHASWAGRGRSGASGRNGSTGTSDSAVLR